MGLYYEVLARYDEFSVFDPSGHRDVAGERAVAAADCQAFFAHPPATASLEYDR